MLSGRTLLVLVECGKYILQRAEQRQFMPLPSAHSLDTEQRQSMPLPPYPLLLDTEPRQPVPSGQSANIFQAYSRSHKGGPRDSRMAWSRRRYCELDQRTAPAW